MLEELVQKLRKFFCEVENRKGENCGKNTLKNLRAAINRHLSDPKICIDIVNDKQFDPCIKVLDGMVKEMTKTGEAEPTVHYKKILPVNIIKIND
ncbi:hypothetical protein KUTeg_012111 [Tegillarca granosa]|uniref:Uncharacterized protein n=1 Tax=Tegillarca granosa TaxID=220873 RepID=A0ABQ9F103_TEGGR|nr:hypothetical protein KUTeg_012111 [Tegillarca granosa]